MAVLCEVSAEKTRCLNAAREVQGMRARPFGRAAEVRAENSRSPPAAGARRPTVRVRWIGTTPGAQTICLIEDAMIVFPIGSE